MAPKPITPRLHGILDYTTGAELLAAPALLGLGGTRTGRLLRAAGAGHIAYSLLTKYELGVAKVLPYKAHLAIDAIAAAGLAAAPWLLGTKTDGVKGIAAPLYFGLFEAAAVALSDRASDQVAQAPGQPLVQTEDGPKAADGEVKLSPPDPKNAVMPDGAEANAAMGARTIGVQPDRGRTGGVGSGTGPGSDPGVGGQLS
jgi:hypothetical protein